MLIHNRCCDGRIDKEFPFLLVLPTREYSCSKEHEGFEGTIWLEEPTLKAIMRDMCSSEKKLLLQS